MTDNFLEWLYDRARRYYCEDYQFCSINCPFYREGRVCTKLTADQKREILMKIYESEVNADNDT